MTLPTFEEAERRRVARLEHQRALARFRTRTRVLRLVGLAVVLLVTLWVVLP
ncbi:hypothetical protein GA0111570_107133 [Raineyella antarctica]|uniref:Uncharacterized protein n=1 Tax=Raineyella antarctica TaxID=1577474 RepID=A0A1G6H8J4_9ACTN|nr:hypothetical protein [Raineyella antarctica]SDB90609.1 hypothetical protein GA0111570_107133 [Raineyella antarctica]